MIEIAPGQVERIAHDDGDIVIVAGVDHGAGITHERGARYCAVARVEGSGRAADLEEEATSLVRDESEGFASVVGTGRDLISAFGRSVAEPQAAAGGRAGHEEEEILPDGGRLVDETRLI